MQLDTPVSHKSLRPKDLDPKHKASFSPFLYEFLKANGHWYSDGGIAQGVYRVLPGSRLSEEYGDGCLLLGYMDVTDMFFGLRLNEALCHGKRASSMCFYACDSVEFVPEFWDEYLKVGRCAIDPNHHTEYRSSVRYSFANGCRTCQWCGLKQLRKIEERTITVESWVTP